MKIKRISNKGFSLLELIIGLAISCIVILAAYSFVLVGSKEYTSTSKNASMQAEVQFIEGVISDSIVNGKYKSAALTTTATYIKLDTGKDIIYYDIDEKKLAKYGSTEIPGTNLDDHLISDKVTDFQVNFEDTGVYETETTSDSSTPTTTPSPSDPVVEKGTSNLVKVKFIVQIKKDTSVYEDTYKIRNK